MYIRLCVVIYPCIFYRLSMLYKPFTRITIEEIGNNTGQAVPLAITKQGAISPAVNTKQGAISPAVNTTQGAISPAAVSVGVSRVSPSPPAKSTGGNMPVVDKV